MGQIFFNLAKCEYANATHPHVTKIKTVLAAPVINPRFPESTKSTFMTINCEVATTIAALLALPICRAVQSNRAVERITYTKIRQQEEQVVRPE